MEHK
jgi:acetylornithine deacetylase/succinyl-diaminopimelate desuccinylase-like protein